MMSLHADFCAGQAEKRTRGKAPKYHAREHPIKVGIMNRTL